MSGLPEFFEQTSDEPYDRHNYRLVTNDGQCVESDDWQTIAGCWFQLPGMFKSHIEVLDKPNNKRPRPSGF